MATSKSSTSGATLNIGSAPKGSTGSSGSIFAAPVAVKNTPAANTVLNISPSSVGPAKSTVLAPAPVVMPAPNISSNVGASNQYLAGPGMGMTLPQIQALQAASAGNVAASSGGGAQNVSSPANTLMIGSPGASSPGVSTAGTRAQNVSQISQADSQIFKNIDPATNLPILDKKALDKILKNSNELNYGQFRENYNKFGWNIKSDASSVKRGAAIYGLKDPSISGMGQAGSSTAELIRVAKELNINPAQFSKVVSGQYGTKTTSIDNKALYNAINNQTKDFYAVTNAINTSHANEKAPHATILFKDDGKGNLVAATDVNTGKPIIKEFKAVRTEHRGADLGQYAPILAVGALAVGMPYLMSAISGAGVGAGTLAAAGNAAGLSAAQVGALTGGQALGLGAGAGLSTGTMAGTMLGATGATLGSTAALGAGALAAGNAGLGSIGSNLVAKSGEDILTSAAKDIGNAILRDKITSEYGNTAGNIAGFGLNTAGLGKQDVFGTGGLSKTLDTVDDTGALTSNQVAGAGKPYDWTGTGAVTSGYDGSNIGSIGSNLGDYFGDITNVSTGASGFPLNTDILSSAASSAIKNQNGTTTFNFDDGSSITTDNVGNVFNTTDSTGTVIGGSSGLPGYIGQLTGPFQPGGGGGLSTGSGIKTGGGGTGGVGTGGVAGGGVDLSKIFSGLSGYQTAASAAQAAAAIYAADQQAKAAKYAQDLQQKRFDLINAQFAPQRGAGYSALNQIRGMLPGQYQQYSETGAPTTMATGTDYLTRQFSPQDLYAGLAPNYNFMLGQGQQAAQRQANVGGGALGGNAQAALQRYTQDYAGNAYQNAFGNFQTQRGNIYNTLAGIAGIGQTAQNTTAQAGQAATNAISQLGVGSAAAQAAGITGAANAVAGGLQNYGVNQTLAQILGQNQNVAQNPNG